MRGAGAVGRGSGDSSGRGPTPTGPGELSRRPGDGRPRGADPAVRRDGARGIAPSGGRGAGPSPGNGTSIAPRERRGPGIEPRSTEPTSSANLGEAAPSTGAEIGADDKPDATPDPDHRAARARRRVSVRTTALTALGAGLAIALPAILRLPSGTTLTFGGPEASGPAQLSPHDSADASTGASSGTPSSAPGTTSGGGANAGPAHQPTSISPATVPSPTADASPTAAASPTAPQTTAKPVTVAAPALAGPTTQISADLAAAYESQVVDLTNAQRAAAGCGALHLDAHIQAAAIAHSVDMRARRYFAHNSPDGETPWQRMADAGYTTPSGENIAMGQATPQDVVTAWMNSPGHRANILNCSSQAVGVGVQFGPGGPWWTQDFGYV